MRSSDWSLNCRCIFEMDSQLHSSWSRVRRIHEWVSACQSRFKTKVVEVAERSYRIPASNCIIKVGRCVLLSMVACSVRVRPKPANMVFHSVLFNTIRCRNKGTWNSINQTTNSHLYLVAVEQCLLLADHTKSSIYLNELYGKEWKLKVKQTINKQTVSIVLALILSN